MTSNVEVIGNEPLADGMKISVRIRRDFTVTDSEKLLASARRAYAELYPDTSEQEAAGMVTCAADAIFAILEHAGVLGDDVDARLVEREADGLVVGGWRANVTVDEPDPLPAGWDCFRTGDAWKD